MSATPPTPPLNPLTAFLRSPVGPFTTHFWGPVFNYGFVIQGAIEKDRPAYRISRNMQMILTFYSMIFMRFSLRVKPKNYLLFSCHLLNTCLQANLLFRRLGFESDRKAQGLSIELSPEEKAEAEKQYQIFMGRYKEPESKE